MTDKEFLEGITMREKFVYRSKYYTAVSALTAEERLQVYDALFDCLFCGKPLDNLSPPIYAVVTLILRADELESYLDEMAG